MRKTPKGGGTNQRVEGAVLGPGRNVLLVDDVGTRGGSIADALSVIRETGASVVAAVSRESLQQLIERPFVVVPGPTNAVRVPSAAGPTTATRTDPEWRHRPLRDTLDKRGGTP